MTVCRFLLLLLFFSPPRWSSGPGDEAKLFLWWHKALNLSAEQLQPQSGQTEVSGVVLGLQRLGTRLLQLGEERLNSGLLGAIGLGKRSPLSNRYVHPDGRMGWKRQLSRCLSYSFRVVVRSLAAFLSVQVQSEKEIRLQPTSDLQLSAEAQQVCNNLCKCALSVL